MRPTYTIFVLIVSLLGTGAPVWAQPRYSTAMVDGKRCTIYPSDNLSRFLRDSLPDGTWVGFHAGRFSEIPAFTATVIKGKVHGVLKQFYTNRELRSEELFVYGKRHGIMTLYNENGYPTGEMTFVDGAQQGPFEFRNEKGLLMQSGFYWQGKPHSEWRWWYPDGVQLRKVRNYVFGVPSGRWVEYYADGKQKLEEFYADSTGAGVEGAPARPPFPTGTWQTWHASGALKSKASYINFAISVKEEYFSDGKPAARYEYVRGQLVKKITYWKSGHPQEEITYAPPLAAEVAMRGMDADAEMDTEPESEEESLRKEGPTNAWYEDGKKRYTGHYVDNVREGEWQWWDAKGKLIHYAKYDQGEVKEEKHY